VKDHAYTVIPAKAGIHRAAMSPVDKWIPAFAGMTVKGTDRVVLEPLDKR
jgi:hypothetical protein